ncbi:unnamed protein product [Cladocopium goreaui]|uniref:Ankyrin repeat and LEM domain-containing protein 1 homolog (LEM-domain containing protein 3) n=1 Tax=Cladocopium goreaui TaxID=2562237 RepID=A0A9P1CBB9_9DINO|nr:unnamed protein product [Cladocopium goreaui]
MVHWYTRSESIRCGAEDGGRASSHRDRIVARHRVNVKQWQAQVLMFLKQNQFTKVNSQKGFFFITFPLHEAVKQKNVMMVKLLLMFGADPTTKDHWGRTAYHYGRNNEDILQVFERCACTPSSPRFKRGTNLQRTPPPIGFEEFFAKVEQDPLVSSPSNESFWLHTLGPRQLRQPKPRHRRGKWSSSSPPAHSRTSTATGMESISTKTSL